MKLFVPGLLLLLSVSACHNNNGKDKPAVPVKKADTAGYYPLAGFFQKQAEFVDLRSFVIRYSHTVGAEKDSMLLTKEMFLKWEKVFEQQAKQFANDKQRYKESVFEDLSTESYTLNYTPAAQQDGIQHIDVLLDNISHTPKRVIIRSVYTRGDTTVTEQYNWKAYTSFQLIVSKKAGTGFSSSEVTYVTWSEK